MISKIKEQFTKERYLRTLTILIGAVIAVFFLKELRNIFIPLFLAIFFSLLFGPLVGFLTRKKVPNFLIMLIMLVIVSVALFLIGTVVYASVISFANEFPKY